MKVKTFLMFLGIILVTSIGESFLPIFPFIALGCLGAFHLGKREKDNV